MFAFISCDIILSKVANCTLMIQMRKDCWNSVLLKCFNVTHLFFLTTFWLTLFIKIQSVYQTPLPSLNYKPPQLQSNSLQFTASSPTDYGTGTIYKGKYTVSFQRLKVTSSYKLVFAMKNLQYDMYSTAGSAYALITIGTLSQQSTFFVAECLVQYKSLWTSGQWMYLAISDLMGNDMYPSYGMFSTVTDIDGVTLPLYRAYQSLSFTSNYKMVFLLRSIDIVNKGNTNYIVWSATPKVFNMTHYNVQIQGFNAILNKMAYIILYYKTSLQYNVASSPAQPIKVITIGQTNMGNGGTMSLTQTLYQSSAFTPAYEINQDNYIISVCELNAELVNFQHIVSAGKLDVSLNNYNTLSDKGFIYFRSGCDVGYYNDGNGLCHKCFQYCLDCTSATVCVTCDTGTTISTGGSACIKTIPTFWGCLYVKQTASGSGTFQCVFCDYQRKLQLTSPTTCSCINGYVLNSATSQCEEVCGDGKRFSMKCDDGNRNNGDGCDQNCQLETGFKCDNTVQPTTCTSLTEVLYRIQSINKSGQKGIITLKPINTNLPFPLALQHFVPQSNFFILTIIVNNNPPTIKFTPSYSLTSIENNKLRLQFDYQFTVQGLTATIQVDYSKTKYLHTTQKIQFTLKGQNQKLQFSGFHQEYKTVQTSLLAAVILSIVVLIVGLLVPKFIGLESIITMQLIFYSQLLIQSEEKWPYGFMVLKYLKFSTGYNKFIDLSEYYPIESISKKYHHLQIEKTLTQNFQTNFIILLLVFIVFFVINMMRGRVEEKLREIMGLKGKNAQEEKKQEKHSLTLQFKKLLRINELIYWMMTQLSIWSILPLMSCIGGQIAIANSITSYKQPLSLILKLQNPLFILITLFISSMLLNHFKNLYLSLHTQQKINQRPQQLLYKQLLIVYLCLIGFLIFFFNNMKIASIIPVSAIALIIHLAFILILLKVHPYRQSLRVHQIGVIINHLLYAGFLVIINIINFVDKINQIIILCLGYAVISGVGLLIILTVVRLYYQIRYGQKLEKQVQLQRKKAEEQEKIRQLNKLQRTRITLQQQAKLRQSLLQIQRQQNPYLIQTQLLEQQKVYLMQWLDKRSNFKQEDKEKYYFNEFHEKPLCWLQQNDKPVYEQKIQQQQQKSISLFQKSKRKKQESQDFIEMVTKIKQKAQPKKSLECRSYGKTSTKYN